MNAVSQNGEGGIDTLCIAQDRNAANQHSHKFSSAAQPYVAGRVGAISARPSRGLETAANITEARHGAWADVPALSIPWSQASCQWYCLIFHTLQQ